MGLFVRKPRIPVAITATYYDTGQTTEYTSLRAAAVALQPGHKYNIATLHRAISNKTPLNGWKLAYKDVSVNGEEVNVAETTHQPVPMNPLTAVFGDEFLKAFEGKQLRVTDETPKRISVFDLIGVVADVENPRTTWADMCEQHPAIVSATYKHTFPGARPTPVTDLQGMITIINLLKGKHAATVRAGQTKLLIRYLGGDESLVEEIQGIAQYHKEGNGRGTIAELAKEQVSITQEQNNLAVPTHKYMLMSPRMQNVNLVTFSNKSVCYLMPLSSKLIKFGYTTDIITRYTDHVREIPDLVGIWFVCEAPKEAEGAFKDHMRYAGKLVSMKLGAKNQTELLQEISLECAEFELCRIVQSVVVRNDVDIRKLELEVEKRKLDVEVEKEKELTQRHKIDADVELEKERLKANTFNTLMTLVQNKLLSPDIFKLALEKL